MKKLISSLLTVLFVFSILIAFQGTEDKSVATNEKKDVVANDKDVSSKTSVDKKDSKQNVLNDTDKNDKKKDGYDKKDNKSDVAADDNEMGEYFHYPCDNKSMIGNILVVYNQDKKSYESIVNDMKKAGYSQVRGSQFSKDSWNVYAKNTTDAKDAIRDIKVYIDKKDNHPSSISQDEYTYYLVDSTPVIKKNSGNGGIVNKVKKDEYHAYFYVCKDKSFGPPITSIVVKDSDKSFDKKSNMFGKGKVVNCTENSYCKCSKPANLFEGFGGKYRYMSYVSNNYMRLDSKNLRAQIKESAKYKKNSFVKSFYDKAKRCIKKLDESSIVEDYTQNDINSIKSQLEYATNYAKNGWGISLKQAYNMEVGASDNRYIGYLAITDGGKQALKKRNYIPLDLKLDSNTGEKKYDIGYTYTRDINKAIRNIKLFITKGDKQSDVLYETVNGKECKFYLVGNYPATLSQDDEDECIDLYKGRDEKMHVYMYVSKDVNAGAPITDIASFHSKTMVIVDEATKEKTFSYIKTFKFSDGQKGEVVSLDPNEYNNPVYVGYRSLTNIDSARLRKALQRAANCLKKEHAYTRVSYDGLKEAGQKALKVVISLNTTGETSVSQKEIDRMVKRLEYNIDALEMASIASIFTNGYFIATVISSLIVIIACVVILRKKGIIKSNK